MAPSTTLHTSHFTHHKYKRKHTPVPSVLTSSKSWTLKALELRPSSLFLGACSTSSGGRVSCCSEKWATNCFSWSATSFRSVGLITLWLECRGRWALCRAPWASWRTCDSVRCIVAVGQSRRADQVVGILARSTREELALYACDGSAMCD